MRMVDKRLTKALDNLVSRGELDPGEAAKVVEEYAAITGPDHLRRRVISEIGGYLGGTFIVIALLILLGDQWQHIPHLVQFTIVLSLASLLFVSALFIGSSTAIRIRLAGSLGAASSFCATLSVVALRLHGREIPALAILVGWITAYIAFRHFRTIIGELGLASFSIALGISLAFSISPHTGNYSYVAALTLGSVGSLWLFLANRRFFDRTFGDAVAMTMLFLSSQFIFDGSLRFVTYLMCVAIAIIATSLYSKAPEWPLLVGAVAAITVGTGEFVSQTLGGSLGAALGLLTSGIFFVLGSVFYFRKSKTGIEVS